MSYQSPKQNRRVDLNRKPLNIAYLVIAVQNNTVWALYVGHQGRLRWIWQSRYSSCLNTAFQLLIGEVGTVPSTVVVLSLLGAIVFFLLRTTSKSRGALATSSLLINLLWTALTGIKTSSRIGDGVHSVCWRPSVWLLWRVVATMMRISNHHTPTTRSLRCWHQSNATWWSVFGTSDWLSVLCYFGEV